MRLDEDGVLRAAFESHEMCAHEMCTYLGIYVSLIMHIHTRALVFLCRVKMLKQVAHIVCHMQNII